MKVDDAKEIIAITDRIQADMFMVIDLADKPSLSGERRELVLAAGGLLYEMFEGIVAPIAAAFPEMVTEDVLEIALKKGRRFVREE